MAIKQREKKTGTGTGSTHRRDEGLGTGKVGNSSRPGGTGNTAKPGSSGKSDKDERGLASDLLGAALSGGSSSSGSSNSSGGLGGALLGAAAGGLLSGGSSGGKKRGGGLGRLILIALLVIGAIWFAKNYLDCGGTPVNPNPTYTPPQTTQNVSAYSTGGYSNDIAGVLSSLGLSDTFGGSGSSSYNYNTGSAGTTQVSANGWSSAKNTGTLDTSVASGTRAKYTQIKGRGRDVFTIMVYMCGTDLESKYGMGTADLQEMLKATVGDQVNLLIYTGGCKQWKNSVMSSSQNQIYQVSGGKLYRVEENMGNASMVLPSTLSEFIRYCRKEYPATRYGLIFWDHGGGSVTGYGYDEKNTRAGSMTLSGINQALKDGGVKFDFVGFDACLMATAETAIMLEDYADYMIASEESEPGYGWYYTDWLTMISNNTSVSTLEIGRNIIDTFIADCAKTSKGQDATLSMIDVAEFNHTVPAALRNFSNATSSQVASDYSSVATARSRSHEFAKGNGIDQIDLVDFAARIGTNEANALVNALKGAVKYNLTSSNLTNCYGVSAYFPYRSSKNVDTAVSQFNSVGVDQSYGKLLQNFASMQVSGQIGSGGNTSYASSIGDLLTGGQNSYSSSSSDLLSTLLGSYFGGGSSSSSSSSSGYDIGSLISGLSGGNTNFFTGRSLSNKEAADYIVAHSFDYSQLNFKEDKDGVVYFTIAKDQWPLVTDIALSVYFDDGEGYIDLGIDNVFEMSPNGDILEPREASWMTVGGQLVAYYYENTIQEGSAYTINGYIPCLLNGELVRLLVVFDNADPYGRITGYQPMYASDDTEVLPKNVTGLSDDEGEAVYFLQKGDKIDWIADCYDYEGKYEDTFKIGEQWTYDGGAIEISNVKLEEGKANMMYRITDIYNMEYWSSAVTNE
ncbi:MAG: peptidase C11 [Lachnospiraceae bacterium]|nr:peptidase C11 [Lachnospiraceae bacterium]